MHSGMRVPAHFSAGIGDEAGTGYVAGTFKVAAVWCVANFCSFLELQYGLPFMNLMIIRDMTLHITTPLEMHHDFMVAV